VTGRLELRCSRQVHGADVVVVDSPAVPGVCEIWDLGLGGLAPRADALVAGGDRFCLAVFTADCAPVALSSPEGVHAALHVGWRGLLQGVVEHALEAMKALGANSVSAGIGPCIHPCCYAFGRSDLEALAARYGQVVGGRTRHGETALDLPGAVVNALVLGGADVVVNVDRCTACGHDYFSHRANGDRERQALLVWRSAASS
jgi:polyphenol oxidase